MAGKDKRSTPPVLCPTAAMYRSAGFSLGTRSRRLERFINGQTGNPVPTSLAALEQLTNRWASVTQTSQFELGWGRLPRTGRCPPRRPGKGPHGAGPRGSLGGEGGGEGVGGGAAASSLPRLSPIACPLVLPVGAVWLDAFAEWGRGVGVTPCPREGISVQSAYCPPSDVIDAAALQIPDGSLSCGFSWMSSVGK